LRSPVRSPPNGAQGTARLPFAIGLTLSLAVLRCPRLYGRIATFLLRIDPAHVGGNTDDVQKAIPRVAGTGEEGHDAANALKIIERNIELAKQKSQPICQDTAASCFMWIVRSASTQSHFKKQQRKP